jgi:hypothetical protein
MSFRLLSTGNLIGAAGFLASAEFTEKPPLPVDSSAEGRYTPIANWQ